MLQKERHDQILSKLNIHGSVHVKEIAKEFKVTEDCIRKDLAILEKEGKLERIHGGATCIRQNPQLYNVNSRKSVYLEEKKKVAQKAISLIQPDSMVFLGISTINIEIAKLIYEKNIKCTVVTNMIDIMQIFMQNSNVCLIFLGGNFNRTRDGFTGSIVNECLKNYHFDLSFIGVVGIDLKGNKVTTYDVEDGLTKKQAIQCCENTYLVVEGAKFEQDGNYVFSNLEDYKGIVTDIELNLKQRKILESKGLEII